MYNSKHGPPRKSKHNSTARPTKVHVTVSRIDFCLVFEGKRIALFTLIEISQGKQRGGAPFEPKLALHRPGLLAEG
jgi:hypothetical protein